MFSALLYPDLGTACEGSAAAMSSSSAQDSGSTTAQCAVIQAPEALQSGDRREVMLNYEIISKQSLKASGHAIDEDCVFCST